VEQDIREALASPGMDSAPKLSALQRLHVSVFHLRQHDAASTIENCLSKKTVLSFYKTS
jgi:hypothetical protein